MDMTCFLLNMKFIIRAAIRVMAETNFIRPENYSLIEAIDLFSDDRNNKPLAIVAKLQPVIFEQRPQPQIVQQIIFGHKIPIRGQLPLVFKKGWYDRLPLISQIPHGLQLWFFNARGVLGVRNVTDRSLTDVLLRAQKYANYGTDRPICLVGLTAGRQTRATIHQGGVSLNTVPTSLVILFTHKQKNAGPSEVM